MSRPDEQLGPSPTEVAPGMHRLSEQLSSSRRRAELERAGWATSVVDLSGASDKSLIMDAFASALGFPDWVGHNWDALDDALRDLSWWPAGRMGRVILLEGTQGPTSAADADHDVLLDVLQTAVDRWASTGSPLVVLLRPGRRDEATGTDGQARPG